MMTFGRFKVTVVNHGFFRLDGGAMFGTVPRTIWTRLIRPDEDNCILLATRSLLVADGDRLLMADLGTGDKLPEKLRRIYAVRNFSPEEAGFRSEDVTDIVLSHLHFDHVGGIARIAPGSTSDLELCFPHAHVHVQADNYETARNPNPREQASYLKEDVTALERSRLELIRGTHEIYPGVWVHHGIGHTRGHQWLEVRSGQESIVFPADLVPTSHHLPLPYSMAYDMSTETLLKEKEDFLARAVAGRWIVVFGHDPDIAAGRLQFDSRGRCALSEVVSL